MSRRLRVVLIVLVVVLLLLGGALAYARPLLLTGTGYAAHNACAVQLLAGRGAAAPALDLPPNPLVPVLRTTVDADAGTATSSVAGLFAQTAWHTPGLGCTLADARPQLAPAEPVPPAPTPATPAPPSPAGTPPTVDREALEAAIDAAFAEDDPEGRSVGTRAVVVVQGGTVLAERYAEGFDADTPQLGWSMAKSVTNAVVGRLVADGVIAVDEDHLLGAWDDDRAAITLDDLLRMASGLEWDEEYSLGSTITEMLYLQPDMGAFAADQPLVADPGTAQRYSSGTTNIICEVLSARTGRGADLPYDLVFEPAGMASAVMEPDASGDPVCSSYMWATPRDWARFGTWFAADGDGTLPDGWVEYSTTTTDVPTEDEGFAAHWWVNRDADGDPLVEGLPADAYWATGHDGQRLFIIPSADLVVLRMGFTPEIGSSELYDGWVADVLRAVGG